MRFLSILKYWQIQICELSIIKPSIRLPLFWMNIYIFVTSQIDACVDFKKRRINISAMYIIFR